MQKEYGLKSIQENYFNSIFIINNYFIFPGGKLIIFFIFLSLLFKIFIDGIKRLGTFIIHIGILFFILFTFLFLNTNEEKYIIIKENESNNIIVNNNLYDITFTINDNKQIKINSKFLNMKDKFKFLPFNIIIKKVFENTNIKINNKLDKNFFKIEKIQQFVENEYNKASVEIEFKNKKNIINNIFLIENLKNEIIIILNENKLHIKLNKFTELLPFEIYLKKFNRLTYNATNLSKSFESDIIINDKNIQWGYNIKMNNPLRYKNYIFYQSSFIEGEKNSTILYVVNNAKINYIYLSCVIILIGFIIHLSSKNRKYYE